MMFFLYNLILLSLIVIVVSNDILSIDSTSSTSYNTVQGYIITNFYPNPAITTAATCKMY